jgi:hypothetical protein
MSGTTGAEGGASGQGDAALIEERGRGPGAQRDQSAFDRFVVAIQIEFPAIQPG